MNEQAFREAIRREMRSMSAVDVARGLESVHRRARRQRRTHVALGAGAAAAVLCLAIAVAAVGSPSSAVRAANPASPRPDVTTAPAIMPAAAPAGRTAGRPPLPQASTTLPSVPTTTRHSDPPAQVFTVPPPGTRVYFLSNSELASAHLDGGDRRVVMTGNPGVPVGVWPDVSRLLLFTTAPDGSYTAIVVLDLSTGARTELVRRPDRISGTALSPDGKRVAYAAPANRRAFASYLPPDDVHVMSAAGGDDHVVTAGADPIWSPDGGMLLVQRCGTDGTGRPCTVKPDGTSLRMLDGFPYQDGYVAWSPDGQWFVGRNGDGRLSVARIDGTGMRVIGKAMGSSRPSFTPDGMRVAYQRLPEGVDRFTGQCGSGCDGRYGIAVAAFDGSGDEVAVTTGQNDGFAVIARTP